jgi:UDP-N-acetylglucosamine 2-epimerase
MTRICVPVGCRSDEGLSAPVIKRLREHFEVDVIQLHPQKFLESYATTEVYFQINGNPDLILITGDRVEMCAAAAAAFHSKVKIAHFYAGVINDPITTFDDIDRHCITLWSDIQFCESKDAEGTIYFDAWNNGGLFGAINKSPNSHVVGISHLDDLEIDESRVPRYWNDANKKWWYDLILYNTPPCISKTQVKDEITEILKATGGSDNYKVLLSNNPDGNESQILSSKMDLTLENLPRPQFLGLLKNCQRFITNSSAAIYEAPHFLKPEQIVMVGDRNKNRPRGPFESGASDKIVAILREWLK